MLKFFKKLADKQGPNIGPLSDNSRAYVIGDIHGCLEELQKLLDKITTEMHREPVPNNEIIFLGDLIDRGPDSCQVIEHLMNFKPERTEVTYLMGNHEEVFLKVLDGNIGALKSWFGFGGRSCMRSYGLDNLGQIHSEPELLMTRIQHIVPDSHFDFLSSFKDHYIFGKYLCVHAGIRPKVPLSKQTSKDMRWIRDKFLEYEKPHPYVVVHGHTVVETPEIHENRIAVDTGAYHGHPLTAVRLWGENVDFIQSY